MKIEKAMIKTITLSYLCLIILANILPLNSSGISLSDSFILNLKSEHLLHTFAYMPAAFLLYFFLNAIFSKSRYLLIMSVLVSFLFGLFTEYLQHFLSYRAFSLNDLLANSIGVILGSVILILFLKQRKLSYF